MKKLLIIPLLLVVLTGCLSKPETVIQTETIEVEKIVEVEVEKIVYIDKIVTKEIPVEKIVYVDKIVEVVSDCYATKDDVTKLMNECTGTLNYSYEVLGKVAQAYQTLQKTANLYKSICGAGGSVIPTYTMPSLSTTCRFNSQDFGRGYTTGAITCY